MALDWNKLKKEMGALVKQIRDAKSKTRDRELNTHERRREYWEAHAEWGSASSRFTKLCVLRSLITGKTHLSPKTDLSQWWPRPRSIDREDLLEWVKPEIAEFGEVVS